MSVGTHLADDAAVQLPRVVVHVAGERVRVAEALAALRARVRQPRGGRRGGVRARAVPPQLLVAGERRAALGTTACVHRERNGGV